MKLYLASSAFHDSSFGLLATIDAAAEHSFAGVQLFLGKSHLCRLQNLRDISERAYRMGLDIIAHLPDKAPAEYSSTLLSLLKYQQEKRAILHFAQNEAVSAFPHVAVGLENAVLGYDEPYYQQLFSTLASGSFFMAFDIPRLFSTPQGNSDRIAGFAVKTLSKLTENDVIHLIDLRSCNGTRSNWCPIGEGIMGAFLPSITRFKGAIVLEFEDLQKALQSKHNLVHYLA